MGGDVCRQREGSGPRCRETVSPAPRALSLLVRAPVQSSSEVLSVRSPWEQPLSVTSHSSPRELGQRAAVSSGCPVRHEHFG